MTICRYCMAEVSEREIEAEDGCCPECGALLSAGGGYLGDEDGYDDLDELEDDEYGYLDDDEEYDDDAYDDEAFYDDDDDFDFEEARLASAFSALPLMRREVLRLLFVEMKEPEEISKILNCSTNYVHLQKSRALKRLRELLTEGGAVYE